MLAKVYVIHKADSCGQLLSSCESSKADIPEMADSPSDDSPEEDGAGCASATSLANFTGKFQKEYYRQTVEHSYTECDME